MHGDSVKSNETNTISGCVFKEVIWPTVLLQWESLSEEEYKQLEQFRKQQKNQIKNNDVLTESKLLENPEEHEIIAKKVPTETDGSEANVGKKENADNELWSTIVNEAIIGAVAEVSSNGKPNMIDATLLRHSATLESYNKNVDSSSCENYGHFTKVALSESIEKLHELNNKGLRADTEATSAQLLNVASNFAAEKNCSINNASKLMETILQEHEEARRRAIGASNCKNADDNQVPDIVSSKYAIEKTKIKEKIGGDEESQFTSAEKMAQNNALEGSAQEKLSLMNMDDVDKKSLTESTNLPYHENSKLKVAEEIGNLLNCENDMVCREAMENNAGSEGKIAINTEEDATVQNITTPFKNVEQDLKTVDGATNKSQDQPNPMSKIESNVENEVTTETVNEKNSNMKNNGLSSDDAKQDSAVGQTDTAPPTSSKVKEANEVKEVIGSLVLDEENWHNDVQQTENQKTPTAAIEALLEEMEKLHDLSEEQHVNISESFLDDVVGDMTKLQVEENNDEKSVRNEKVNDEKSIEQPISENQGAVYFTDHSEPMELPESKITCNLIADNDVKIKPSPEKNDVSSTMVELLKEVERLVDVATASAAYEIDLQEKSNPPKNLKSEQKSVDETVFESESVNTNKVVKDSLKFETVDSSEYQKPEYNLEDPSFSDLGHHDNLQSVINAESIDDCSKKGSTIRDNVEQFAKLAVKKIMENLEAEQAKNPEESSPVVKEGVITVTHVEVAPEDISIRTEECDDGVKSDVRTVQEERIYSKSVTSESPPEVPIVSSLTTQAFLCEPILVNKSASGEDKDLREPNLKLNEIGEWTTIMYDNLPTTRPDQQANIEKKSGELNDKVNKHMIDSEQQVDRNNDREKPTAPNESMKSDDLICIPDAEIYCANSLVDNSFSAELTKQAECCASFEGCEADASQDSIDFFGAREQYQPESSLHMPTFKESVISDRDVTNNMHTDMQTLDDKSALFQNVMVQNQAVSPQLQKSIDCLEFNDAETLTETKATPSVQSSYVKCVGKLHVVSDNDSSAAGDQNFCRSKNNNDESVVASPSMGDVPAEQRQMIYVKPLKRGRGHFKAPIFTDDKDDADVDDVVNDAEITMNSDTLYLNSKNRSNRRSRRGSRRN